MANKSKILYDGRVFSGLDIKGGKMHIATSLLSSSLEANTFSPVIKSDDRTLVEFKRNTPMIYFYNDRQKGVFYVQDIQRTGPDLYQFSATSAIGLLSDGQHYAGSILARQCLNCCLGCAARSHMPSKAIWRASNCMDGFRYPLPGTTWPKCSLQLGRQSKTIWTACFESRLYGTGSAETWAVDGCIRGLLSNTDPRSPRLL